jgi:hypothetical protein
MEEFDPPGGFFAVDEENNPFQQIDDAPREYDSDPEILDRTNTKVPPVSDTVRKQLKRQIYSPITCKNFMDASSLPDDIFYWEGMFFKDICLIGRAVSVSTSSKNTQIMVNDNWGSVDVTIMYKDYESQPVWAKKIQQNDYYKFYGQGKVFKDRKAIYLTHASKVTDFNEITHHFLNVFLNKCIREKGVLSPLELKKGHRLLNNANEESKDSSYEHTKDVSVSVPLPPTPKKSSPSKTPIHVVKEAILAW